MADSKTVSQASVVPFRPGEDGIEFCLITTRKSRRWAFPKGRVGKRETLEKAALNEAKEEAGLIGRIIGEPIGTYAYKKGGRKWTVTVMLMAVDGCSDQWKESDQRLRKWVSLQEACFLLGRPKLIQLLNDAVRQLTLDVLDVLDVHDAS